MANNYEAGGSNANNRPLSFTIEDASILSKNNILVPQGWKISIGGLVVPPIPPKGPVMNAYIKRRCRALPPEQRNDPNWPVLSLSSTSAHPPAPSTTSLASVHGDTTAASRTSSGSIATCRSSAATLHCTRRVVCTGTSTEKISVGVV
jgi:hypothetical protein